MDMRGREGVRVRERKGWDEGMELRLLDGILGWFAGV